MAYTDKGKLMGQAAEAHSDLNMFHAVMALMESGLLSSDCNTAAERIIKICQAESAKCLRRFDAAIGKAGGGSYE